MSDVEAEHAEVLKLDRLEWLRDTFALLYAREVAEPGYLDEWSVMGLHASTHSWVTRVLTLDVPA